MTTTRHASIDTDHGSRAITFQEPRSLREIACAVSAMLRNKGRYDLTPCVTISADGIARVTFA